MEEVGVLVGRRRGHDSAVTGEDVELDDRLVRAAVAPGGALDAETRDRAAQSDGAQLGNAEWHEAVRKCGRDQVLVGGHSEDVGRA